jgi:hypothetical protein
MKGVPWLGEGDSPHARLFLRLPRVDGVQAIPKIPDYLEISRRVKFMS